MEWEYKVAGSSLVKYKYLKITYILDATCILDYITRVNILIYFPPLNETAPDDVFKAESFRLNNNSLIC